MRKLPKPEDDPKAYFQECVSRSRPADKRQRLLDSADAVEMSCVEYDAKAAGRSLYEFSRITGFVASDDELYKVYDSGTRQGGAGRELYDRLLLSSPNRVCTLCWRRGAEELDHYLPRSEFQELSTAPSNLIPVCNPCNSAAHKGTHVPTSYTDQFIHPYFDDYTNARWLFGRALAVEGEIAIHFTIEVPDSWSEVELERLRFHFNTLGLWELYSANAASEMENISDVIVSAKLQEAGVIHEFLGELANKKCQKNPNSWETATYFALMESDLFIEKMAGTPLE